MERLLRSVPTDPPLPSAGPEAPPISDMDHQSLRVGLVDKLRGLMIVLMVLDHVREFTHVDALLFQPNDLSQTSTALFVTRWVTHLCAPTFVFLSGVSVYLQQANGKVGLPLTRFLISRGLWLIFLELTVITLGFNLGWPFVFLQVIWAIGVGMILLAGLTWLPPAASVIIGLVIIAGHQLLAQVAATQGFDVGLAWTLAMKPGPVGFAPGFVAYPALPWFGIMALGYGLGGRFVTAATLKSRDLLKAGFLAIAAFALVRYFNAYGDPTPWDHQSTATFTALSFINLSKYPPSLLYVLATLGASLMIAPVVEQVRGPAGNLMQVFGKAPLFTYLLHVYLAHGLAVVIGIGMGLPVGDFLNFLGDPSRLVQKGWGISLAGVYICWAVVVLALWWPARWFARLKHMQRKWWLSYL